MKSKSGAQITVRYANKPRRVRRNDKKMMVACCRAETPYSDYYVCVSQLAFVVLFSYSRRLHSPPPTIVGRTVRGTVANSKKKIPVVNIYTAFSVYFLLIIHPAVIQTGRQNFTRQSNEEKM